jgi:hypothetical protein
VLATGRLGCVVGSPIYFLCIPVCDATIYYAAFRPGELQELRLDQLTLPASGWGEVLLVANNPEISPRWSDTRDAPCQPRELKQRAKVEVRPVPSNPRLVAILRRHADTFGVAADGRLFRSGREGPVKATRYLQVWRQARKAALTLVYARCIVGQDEAARQRIDAALAAEDQTVEATAADAARSQPWRRSGPVAPKVRWGARTSSSVPSQTSTPNECSGAVG